MITELLLSTFYFIASRGASSNMMIWLEVIFSLEIALPALPEPSPQWVNPTHNSLSLAFLMLALKEPQTD